ncbi:hypothetical protein C8R47DRAFT_1054920 [Mycena vitilis]|nr:hypothetical protein C8R47DRAFT_1054920 [Mycena vitilis]
MATSLRPETSPPVDSGTSRYLPSIDADDPVDLRSYCRTILAARYPSVSDKDCTTILAADETLFDDLKQALRSNGGTAHIQDILAKASAIYEALKSGNLHETVSEPPVAIAEKSVESILVATATFVAALRPRIEQFVDQDDPVKRWCPSSEVEEPDYSWLKAQEFPATGGKPDFLLHNLGSFAHNPELRERLEMVFEPETVSHKFLVNTSGSGKTRLMLEGLCLYWGFYFASAVDSNRVGSFDVQNAIESYVPDSQGFTEALPDTAGHTAYMLALENNRRIAARRFTEILLARLVIFQLFIEVIKTRLDILEPKKLWLLLQLYPHRLGYGDIFVRLTVILRGSPHEWLKDQIQERFEAIQEWCYSYENTPFFIVLDEAQHAARRHFSAFRSEMQLHIHRPILREIVRAWVIDFFAFLGFWMVISGTGIDHATIGKVIASAVMKPAAYQLLSSIGGFPSLSAHANFVERYIPPRILEMPRGRALVERITRWLHGRHRFTTAFVTELLSRSFRSPHRLLDAFVRAYTGITPTDGQRWIAEENDDAEWPTALELDSFDFQKLYQSSGGLKDTLIDIVNSNVVRTDLPKVITAQHKLLVEYGFARYTTYNVNKIIVDEPLVLLAFSRDEHSAIWYANRLGTGSAAANGFEDYLAFTLPSLFRTKPRLDEVFDFAGIIPAWSSHRTELVSVFKSEWSATPEIFPVLPDARPHFGYGTDAGSDCRVTVNWLKHDTRTFVCFPPKGMGPDLIFVLRVLDGSPEGSLLWVAMQAKFSEASSYLSMKALRSAVRSTTPARYWINKRGLQHAPVAHPDLAWKTSAALAGLPNRISDYAGNTSVLRVVASCPTPGALSRAENLPVPHYEDGPVACLNRQFLAAATKHLVPLDKIASLIEGFREDPVLVRKSTSVTDDGESASEAEAEQEEDTDMPATKRSRPRTRKRPASALGSGSDGGYAPPTSRSRGKQRRTQTEKSDAGQSNAGKGKKRSPAKKARKGGTNAGDDISMASGTSARGSTSMWGSSRAMSVDRPAPSVMSVASDSTGFTRRSTRGGREYS